MITKCWFIQLGCTNVEQKRIQPERDSSSEGEADDDGNWCAMRCELCHHFFGMYLLKCSNAFAKTESLTMATGNQLLAETPVFTFRRVDLVVEEPRVKSKASLPHLQLMVFILLDVQEVSSISLKRKQPQKVFVYFSSF